MTDSIQVAFQIEATERRLQLRVPDNHSLVDIFNNGTVVERIGGGDGIPASELTCTCRSSGGGGCTPFHTFADWHTLECVYAGMQIQHTFQIFLGSVTGVRMYDIHSKSIQINICV